MSVRVLESWDRTIECWSKMRVLVIGDVMLDVERHCVTGSTFNEFGTHTLKETSYTYHAGGAANLAVNLKRLGCASVDLIGAVSDDPDGAEICNLLADGGVYFLWRHGYIRRYFSATTLKERIYRDGRPLHRIDRDVCNRLPIAEVLDTLNRQFRSGAYDALVLSDYQKGAFLYRSEVEALCRRFMEQNPNAIVTANLKPQLIRGLFTGYRSHNLTFALIQLNNDEMEALVGKECRDPAREVLRLTGAGHVLHTMGSQGLLLVDKNGGHASVPGYRIRKGSTVGAGDTTLAAATLAHLSETSLAARVVIANAAGAARVERTDRQWITPEEIRRMMFGHPS